TCLPQHFDTDSFLRKPEMAPTMACINCDNRFLRKSELIRHKCTQNVTAYSCPGCNKPLGSVVNIPRHISKSCWPKGKTIDEFLRNPTITKFFSYSCIQCSKLFFAAEDLQCHANGECKEPKRNSYQCHNCC